MKNYTYQNAQPVQNGPMYKIRLKEVIDLDEKTRSYNFEKPEDLTWSEGAHTHLAHESFLLEGVMDKSMIRHMSIYTMPEEGYIGVTTRIPELHSDYKEFLKDMIPGAEMFVFKTQNHMPLRREDKNVVLISMGVGISTMRPYIKSYIENSSGIKSMTNINVDRGNYIYADELNAIEHVSFENAYVPSRKDLFEKIDAEIHLSESLYYIVGSDKFLGEVIAHLLKRGVYKGDIMIDKHEEKREAYNI